MRALTVSEMIWVVGGQSAPPSGGGDQGGGRQGGGSQSGGNPGGNQPNGTDRSVGRERDGGISFFEGGFNRARDFKDNIPGQLGELLDEGLEWIQRNNMGTPGAYVTAKIGHPEPL